MLFHSSLKLKQSFWNKIFRYQHFSLSGWRLSTELHWDHRHHRRSTSGHVSTSFWRNSLGNNTRSFRKTCSRQANHHDRPVQRYPHSYSRPICLFASDQRVSFPLMFCFRKVTWENNYEMKLTVNECIESSFCYEKSSCGRETVLWHLPHVPLAFVALFMKILSCITQCDVCDVMWLRFQLCSHSLCARHTICYIHLKYLCRKFLISGFNALLSKTCVLTECIENFQ